MLRGRCSCAISACPCPSPVFSLPLSPLFTLHPGKPPVTPLFPLLTQKQGGGGVFSFASSASFTFFSSSSLSPNSFVFSRHSNYMLNYMNTYIVGAPTFVTLLTTNGKPRNRSKDRPLQRKNTARLPPAAGEQKDGPYTNCELSAVDCGLDSPKHAFYREIIKYVEAPTIMTLLTRAASWAEHCMLRRRDIEWWQGR